MKSVLTKKQLSLITKSLHADWAVSTAGTKMSRTFSFRNYIEAFMFVTRVSVHAEVMDHHPEINLTYGKVVVTLTTHSKQKITSLDTELALKVDSIFSLSTAATKLRLR